MRIINLLCQKLLKGWAKVLYPIKLHLGTVKEVKQNNPEVDRKRHQDEIRKLVEEKKIEKEIELRPPPADQFTILHPTNISPLDL